ncbi:MAG: hypothetical protein KJ622_04520 [Alphaproteobacteria bacterium]|nr:hypothetical protein [Alphaproteobacteria bacterium]
MANIEHRTPRPAAATAEAQASCEVQNRDENYEPEAQPSNTSVMVLAGSFIAAMVAVVAAEFVRRSLS